MAGSEAAGVVQAHIPDGCLIYDLITANNLHEIRAQLNALTLRHRKLIVCQTVSRKTLLVYACELGFRDIVKYLLDECEADISEPYTCQVLVSPLRVIVDNMDVSLLLLLISRGAVGIDKQQVRWIAHYAFDRAFFSLATILRHYTNDVDPTHYNTDVADLFYWMTDVYLNANTDCFIKASECGDVDRMRDLLADGILRKRLKDFHDNPLCTTILNRDSNAEHFLLNYRVFSLKDHVHALELCGATLIAYQSEFEKGLACWRKALRIRNEEFFGESDKLENDVHTDLGVEFSCEEHLDTLENHFTELYTQALVVFQRLLPPFNLFLQNAFEVVARNCALRKDLFRAIKVLAEFFDLPYVLDSGYVSPYRRSLLAIDDLILDHFTIELSSPDDFIFKFRNLMDFINGVNWDVLLRGSREFYRFGYLQLLKSVLDNVIVMEDFEPCKNDEVWIADGVRTLLQLHHHPYPTTLLHLAIEDPDAHPAVPFILSCSADANCTDDEKNTPMHVVALLPKDDTNLPDLVNLLADAGGHIDAVNQFNMTPLFTLAAKGVLRNPLKFLSLQCLAAQTIDEYGITIPNVYPKILVSFIKLHSS